MVDSRNKALSLRAAGWKRSRTPEPLRGSEAVDTPVGTIAFHGAKGGVGATFLAAESAAMLSAAGRRVAAVDTHSHRGCLHYRLDVPLGRDAFTVEDLLPVLDDLSYRVLDNALSSCPCGARLLPSAASGDRSGALAPEQLQALCAALAPRFEHVVIDTPSSREGVALAGSLLIDLVVLVVVPELSCLGVAKRALEAFDGVGFGRKNIALIVNRSLGRLDTVTLSDVESFLEIPAIVVLPEETGLCRRVMHDGTFAYVEGSPLGRGLRAMARRLF